MRIQFELTVLEARHRWSFVVNGLGLLAVGGMSGCGLTNGSVGPSGELGATDVPSEIETAVEETIEALSNRAGTPTGAPATAISPPTLDGSDTLDATQTLEDPPSTIPPTPQLTQTPLALAQQPTTGPELEEIIVVSTPVPDIGVEFVAFDLYCINRQGADGTLLESTNVYGWYCRQAGPPSQLESIDMYDLCLFSFGGGEPRFADFADPYSWTCNIDYSALEIGTFGGAESKAFGIDPFGNVVGTAQASDGTGRAFIYFTVPCSGPLCLTGMVQLYELNQDLGGATSHAFALNANRWVVGQVWVENDPFPAAFIWDLNANEIGHYFLGTGNYSLFSDITGDVAVGYTIRDGSARSFRVDLSGAGYYGDLGSFGGARGTVANATNGKEVVGQSRDSSGNRRAFWWQPLAVYPQAEMLELGELPGDSESEAFDISASHSPGRSMEVVGYSKSPTGTQRAVLWRAFHSGINFSVTKLALNSLGGTRSQANAVNSSIQIVGWSYASDGEKHAAIWSEDGSVTDLNVLISPSAGWDLLIEATDINDAGQIAGVGLFQGQMRGFLLTPNQ